MDVLHHDLDLLLAAAAGEVPERELRRRRRRHRDALCPECGHRSRLFALYLADRARRRPESRGRCYAAVALGLFDLAEVFVFDRPEVERELERLRKGVPHNRASRVHSARLPRFHSPLLAEALIAEARGRLRHDAGDALRWLAAAGAVVERAGSEVDRPEDHAPLSDLRLLIRAHEGNAHRVLGELAAADRTFARLRRIVARTGPPALAVTAELASLEASLRIAQRRLVEAEALLEHAAPFYRWAGDPAGLAKVLIQRARVLYRSGEPERAIPCLEEAAAAVDGEREPQLAFNAHHNLALNLCATGRPEPAAEALGQARALYPRLGDPTNLDLLLWAEGKLAAADGRDEEALERLHAARSGYAVRGLAYDVALVDLDLAEVHLRRGETAEVQRLAERMTATFAEREVEPEAARAVAMFARAALAEALTAEILARTRNALLRTPRRRPAAPR